MKSRRLVWGYRSLLCIVGIFLIVSGKGGRALSLRGTELNCNKEIRVVQEKKKIALTFDDGPHPVYTKMLLDGLKARGIKASFFVIGENVEKYPQVLQQTAKEGHLIGNHTYHHVILNQIDIQSAHAEITETNQLIEQTIGQQVLYLRPPYGAWEKKKELPEEMIGVFWDIDPLDWKIQDTKRIVQEVIENVKEGEIILLHDVYQSSIEAAFLIIDELEKQGYSFVTVEELFFE